MSKESYSSKSILELSNDEARDFFLKPDSYCNIEFPPYISFKKLIDEVSQYLSGKQLSTLINNPKDHDDINYKLFSNKDGKYSWRPLHLIHPVLYVSLVHQITDKTTWQTLCERFQAFAKNDKIECLSLPVISMTDETNKAEQISHWWRTIEQKSVELSLEYECLLEADITDCYGSIYTHSIAWAIHGKESAKERTFRNNQDHIGNDIDKHIQFMCYGQTNGIPQGSVLMDFIAEIVLGYIDLELSEKINTEQIENYRILRYRDDYRIFAYNLQNAEKILKILTESTIMVGLKLNSSKTKASADVVRSSIKSDKLAWMARKQSDASLQKSLLIIHEHSFQFPNSGSLRVALNKYYKRLLKRKKPIEGSRALISIVVDIAYKNPKTYHICAAILSKLLSVVESDEDKLEIISKMTRKFSLIPNTGHMLIWLQRITYKFDNLCEYEEDICKLVSGTHQQLWNDAWIKDNGLKNIMTKCEIIDSDRLKEMQPIIPSDEIDLYRDYYELP